MGLGIEILPIIDAPLCSLRVAELILMIDLISLGFGVLGELLWVALRDLMTEFFAVPFGADSGFVHLA